MRGWALAEGTRGSDKSTVLMALPTTASLARYAPRHPTQQCPKSFPASTGRERRVRRHVRSEWLGMPQPVWTSVEMEKAEG